MNLKILTQGITILFVLSQAIALLTTFVDADENQPQWPTNWILFDIDPPENGDSDDYRDVHNAYYYTNDYYLYLRLECYGFPNFTTEPESRYKWFIDIDDPHNMGQSGGNVYEAEYLLFIEDSPKPGGDGIGDIYLLKDLDNDGFIQDDWPDYLDSPGPILNSSVADYKIDGNYLDVYIRQENISNPLYSYVTWATDQEDPNLDSAPNIDRSNNYWDADLSKADLSIIKSDSLDPVIAGTSLVYTLNITNHGPNVAENVTVSDILPSGITYNSANPTPNDINGSFYWWTFSSLDIGESKLITINITVDAEVTGNITNIAKVYNDTRDPFLSNNEAIEQTKIVEIVHLSIIIYGNGSVSRVPDKEFYVFGDVVDLFAVADLGWSFVNWSGDLIGTGGSISIVMDGDKSVVALFMVDYYTLDVVVDGNGSVSRVPDKEFYVFGDVVDLFAVADLGWTFCNWTYVYSVTNSSMSIVMDDDKVVTALFIENQYILDVIVDGNGYVVKDPDKEFYVFGDVVNLTAVTLEGSTFDHWSGNLSSNDNPIAINMTENKSVTAHFVISGDNGGNGGNGGSSGGGGGSSYSVEEVNEPPVADLSAGELYIGFIDEEMDFNGSFSYDHDGYIVEWLWDFGDGSTALGEIVSHAYLSPGEYLVTLRVTDDKGASDTDNTTAIIIQPNRPPSEPDIDGPTEGFVDIDYLFSFVSTDEDNDEIKYTIDWGDGSYDESDFLQSGDFFNISHRWTEPGIYLVNVTADDDDTITKIDFTITIDEQDIPEESNIILILILLLGLLLLLLFLYLLKSKKDDKKEEENNKKNT